MLSIQLYGATTDILIKLESRLTMKKSDSTLDNISLSNHRNMI